MGVVLINQSVEHGFPMVLRSELLTFKQFSDLNIILFLSIKIKRIKMQALQILFS